MPTVTRRRTARSEEPEEARDEKPTRRGRRSENDSDEKETPRRGRRSTSEDKADEPDEDAPRRGRRSRDSGEDEGGSRGSRRRGARGFSSFEQKKAKTSSYADDFKPGADNKTLIKFLEDEPFDSYNQHWIESRDLPRDVKRNSYMCADDEYFENFEDEGCPLCDIGEPAKTYSLFNVLDLTNPRKPEVKVWTAPPGVSDKLARAAKDKKTSPLNREDVYFEVELVKSKNKSEWTITPVKARDLLEDFEIDPFTEDELKDFAENLFEDRSAVTKVDTVEELTDLAESLN